MFLKIGVLNEKRKPLKYNFGRNNFHAEDLPDNRNVISFSGIFLCDFADVLIKYSEEVLQTWSYEKIIWKYAANLQQNIHVKVWFRYCYYGGCSPVNMLHIFKTISHRNSSGVSGRLLLYILNCIKILGAVISRKTFKLSLVT